MINEILNKIYLYDKKLTYQEKIYLKKYIEENEIKKLINKNSGVKKCM